MEIVSYGGGTNSTALLVGLAERGERPGAIVFADTGGEKPHTYDLVGLVSKWGVARGFPPIAWVKGGEPQQVKDGSLENECLRLNTVPSKVMGFGACSEKWKIRPFKKWLATQELSAIPTKLIGMDAGEEWRARNAERFTEEEKIYKKRYPLIEWGWDREDCQAAISRAGLPQPGKSACFFCPNSKKHEILDLQRRYPDLLDRALEMEARAKGREGKLKGPGLGRRFSWRRFVELTGAQMKLLPDLPDDLECVCYDG